MVMMMKMTMMLFVGAWPCMCRNSPYHRCKQVIPLDDGDDYDDGDDDDDYDDDNDDYDDYDDCDNGDDGRGHVPEATGANSPSTA